MNTKRHPFPLVVTLLAFAFAAGARAQNQNPNPNQNPNGQAQGSNAKETPLPKRFWQASTSGGDYMVALSSISNIAKHQYIVDGTVRVFEMTVTASGSSIARFYFLEPISDGGQSSAAQTIISRLKSTAEEATKRAGSDDVWKKVVKNYPTTTHAHTVEFRLKYKSDIDRLYSSVHRAWYDGKGAKLTIRNQ